MKLATIVLLAAVVMFLSLGAFAVDATGNLSVSANVQNVCSVTDGSIDFGTYDPASGSPKNVTGTFSVQCTNGGTAHIKLDQGQNGTGTLDAPVRRLANGSNYLSYALFSDTDRVIPWEGTNGVDFTGSGDMDEVTVYGQMSAGQSAIPGSYTDTVQVTVTY